MHDKWKNHLKGDVGMSPHEKNGEKDAYTTTVIHKPNSKSSVQFSCSLMLESLRCWVINPLTVKTKM